MSIKISLEQPPEERWNDFVERSNEGTIFHRLDFLRYHGVKFDRDVHHLIWRKGEEIFGVMPMAIVHEHDEVVARSPYGASYGGPVFARPISYAESHEVVATMLEHLSGLGALECSLTLPIASCYQTYSDTFRLALIEAGFDYTRREISSVVPLHRTEGELITTSSRARRMVRKAEGMGVSARHNGDLADFWSVLEKTFDKHGSSPTHTLAEYQWLSRRFPNRIYADVAYLGGSPVAGIGVFVVSRLVMTSFYLCQDPERQEAQGLTLLVHTALQRAAREGFRWFDLGTSSIDMEGRPNIFRFKEGFGAVGLFRETYKWSAGR